MIDPIGDSHVITLEKASVRTTAVEQTYSGEKPEIVLLEKYEERKVQWKSTSNPILTYRRIMEQQSKKEKGQYKHKKHLTNAEFKDEQPFYLTK